MAKESRDTKERETKTQDPQPTVTEEGVVREPRRLLPPSKIQKDDKTDTKTKSDERSSSSGSSASSTTVSSSSSSSSSGSGILSKSHSLPFLSSSSARQPGKVSSNGESDQAEDGGQGMGGGGQKGGGGSGDSGDGLTGGSVLGFTSSSQEPVAIPGLDFADSTEGSSAPAGPGALSSSQEEDAYLYGSCDPGFRTGQDMPKLTDGKPGTDTGSASKSGTSSKSQVPSAVALEQVQKQLATLTTLLKGSGTTSLTQLASKHNVPIDSTTRKMLDSINLQLLLATTAQKLQAALQATEKPQPKKVLGEPAKLDAVDSRTLAGQLGDILTTLPGAAGVGVGGVTATTPSSQSAVKAALALLLSQTGLKAAIGSGAQTTPLSAPASAAASRQSSSGSSTDGSRIPPLMSVERSVSVPSQLSGEMATRGKRDFSAKPDVAQPIGTLGSDSSRDHRKLSTQTSYGSRAMSIASEDSNLSYSGEPEDPVTSYKEVAQTSYYDRPPRATADKDYGRPPRAAAETDYGRPARATTDTDYSRPAHAAADTDYSRPPRAMADTDYGRPARAMTDTDYSRPSRATSDTDYGRPPRATADADYSRPPRATADTDYSRPSQATTDTDYGTARPPHATADTDYSRPSHAMADTDYSRPSRAMPDKDYSRPPHVTADTDYSKPPRATADTDYNSGYQARSVAPEDKAYYSSERSRYSGRSSGPGTDRSSLSWQQEASGSEHGRGATGYDQPSHRGSGYWN